MNLDYGKIEILLNNVDKAETLRIKKVIDTLFSNGIFNMSNGWVKLNFDNDKNLSSIEKNQLVWRHNRLTKNVNESIMVSTIS